MTPQEQELVKKLDEQVNNFAHLTAGTEAGESQTLKEIRDLVYLLNKSIEPKPTDQDYLNECPSKIINTNTTQPPY